VVSLVLPWGRSWCRVARQPRLNARHAVIEDQQSLTCRTKRRSNRGIEDPLAPIDVHPAMSVMEAKRSGEARTIAFVVVHDAERLANPRAEGSTRRFFPGACCCARTSWAHTQRSHRPKKDKHMPTIEASLARLLDEAAIRDATARFADSVMRQDYDAFRTLWADEAEWAIGKPFEQRAKGVDDIVSMLRNLWNGNDSFIQFAVQGVIDIDGDDDTARCVCHEAASGPRNRYYRTNGVWLDRLQRSKNGWRFTSRAYQYRWLDMSPSTGDTFSSNRSDTQNTGTMTTGPAT
jgi:hypothetical protein